MNIHSKFISINDSFNLTNIENINFICDVETNKSLEHALSKGGSGDVLAGITASLVAQGCSPHDACITASHILGSTAEMLGENASQRGILASDIIKGLPVCLKTLEDPT